MAKHYWFKFEWAAWRDDKQLRRCSKETRGFWIDCIAEMEDQDTYFLEGTAEELCRVLFCSAGELERSTAQLLSTNAASVEKSQDTVKIVSRRLLKKHNLTEYNRLKKQESRDKLKVKPVSDEPSKDLKIKSLKAKEKKEEKKKKEDSFFTFPIPRSDADPALWTEWLTVRRSIKKPLTQRGYDLLVKDLSSLVAFDINERLAKAIDLKWQGLVFDNDKNGYARRENHVRNEPTKPTTVSRLRSTENFVARNFRTEAELAAERLAGKANGDAGSSQ